MDLRLNCSEIITEKELRQQVLFMAKRWERDGFHQKKKFKMVIIICTTRAGTKSGSWQMVRVFKHG